MSFLCYLSFNAICLLIFSNTPLRLSDVITLLKVKWLYIKKVIERDYNSWSNVSQSVHNHSSRYFFRSICLYRFNPGFIYQSVVIAGSLFISIYIKLLLFINLSQVALFCLDIVIFIFINKVIISVWISPMTTYYDLYYLHSE